MPTNYQETHYFHSKIHTYKDNAIMATD